MGHHRAVDQQPSPTIFEHSIQVAPEEIDRQGHVNNVVYLRYAQDAAIAHWKSVASATHFQDLFWVARRHEIDYLKPAFPDDVLLARTWVGEAEGATFERFVEIIRPADKQVLTKVRTLWVALDARSKRPRRVPRDLAERFKQSPAPENQE